MSKPSKTPLLDQIHTPDDLRRLDESQLRQVADKTAEGRVVSVLEGGYDLEGLSKSAAAHVIALMRG